MFASRTSSSPLLLGSWAAAFVLVLTIASCSCSVDAARAPPHPRDIFKSKFSAVGDSKVTVEYYEEALCPDCCAFGFREFDKGIEDFKDYINVTVVPYGNARYDESTDTYTCQHGPEECYLNRVQNCLAYYSSHDLDKYWPFFKCSDQVVSNNYPNINGISKTVMTSCANTLPGLLTPDILDSCATGGLGDALYEKARLATEALNPPHTFVPWVVIDGQALEMKFNQFYDLLCNAVEAGNPSVTCSPSST